MIDRATATVWMAVGLEAGLGVGLERGRLGAVLAMAATSAAYSIARYRHLTAVAEIRAAGELHASRERARSAESR